ncbi:hypothetical protein PIB30_099336 [Stylosanthes scabra]|uniref:Uncharacterized protein n=1 Tax=Stylosanthes scabra TaxID=79078 RepID=A0ABU6XWG0_9FABA|nr:hypothetical protein [Stylosanthes scabra]
MGHNTLVNTRANASHGIQPPPLLEVPLRRWFTNKKEWKCLQNLYSNKAIMKPRHLSGLLPKDKHPVPISDVDAITSKYLNQMRRKLNRAGAEKLSMRLQAKFLRSSTQGHHGDAPSQDCPLGSLAVLSLSRHLMSYSAPYNFLITLYVYRKLASTSAMFSNNLCVLLSFRFTAFVS